MVHQRLQFIGPAAAVERHIHLLQLPVLLEQREELAHVLERHRNPPVIRRYGRERLTAPPCRCQTWVTAAPAVTLQWTDGPGHRPPPRRDGIIGRDSLGPQDPTETSA